MNPTNEAALPETVTAIERLATLHHKYEIEYEKGHLIAHAIEDVIRCLLKLVTAFATLETAQLIEELQPPKRIDEEKKSL